MERELRIPTADGNVECVLIHPEGAGPWPAVLHLMDGLGFRPNFKSVSAQVAAQGYCVLAPNLYYRKMPPRELNLATELDLVMELVMSLDQAAIAKDVDAFIRFLDAEPTAKTDRIGVVGYCMSGALALGAAAHRPDRVAAALSFHGGRLATDSPDSVHRLAGRMKAKMYVGVAADDFKKDPCETARLRGAFEATGARAEIELYPDCNHGWTIPGREVYNEAGSKKHFEKIFGLFAETLR